MIRIFGYSFFIPLLILIGSLKESESADFQKGLSAAQEGNFTIALREWEPIAEQGDARAQFNLGVMNERGDGLPQNYKTAVKWYTLAAEQGIAIAQTNLGLMYSEGTGVQPDLTLAVKWYTLAAKQEVAAARANLSWSYSKVEDTPKKYGTVKEWTKHALQQGIFAAQTNMALMYGKGKGVPQDNIIAHMWWNIVASSGDTEAVKERDRLERKMTSDQILKAQKLARECFQKKSKQC